MFTTIQDGGRKGLAYYGIPPSGFMDRASAQTANILVGNSKNAALLEMTYIGAQIYFEEEAVIAITGADMQAQVNQEKIKTYQTIFIEKETTLQFKNSISGVRTYLAIHGKWKLTKHYKSSATYTYAKMGGLNGNPIQKNDVIEIQNINQDVHYIDLPPQFNWNEITKITLQKGPEWKFLNNPDQIKNEFSISPQNDRMGALLSGEAIDINIPNAFPSQAVFPGVVQCTPSGKLIVVLQDGQTTGGYPRIGIIPRENLNLFNQLRIGKVFKFEI